MKKIKFILPIASVAAAATAIVPLATSCGSSVDLTKFEPTIAQFEQPSPADAYDYESATKTYIDEIIKNPKILTEDMLYTFQAWIAINVAEEAEVKPSPAEAKMAKTETTSTYKVELGNAKINNLKFEKGVYDVEGGDSYTLLILNGSYEVNFKSKVVNNFNENSSPQLSKNEITSQVNLKVNLKNAPYKLINTTWNGMTGSDAMWTVMPALYSEAFAKILDGDDGQEKAAVVYEDLLNTFSTYISFDVTTTLTDVSTFRESGKQETNTTINSISEYIDKDHLASIDVTKTKLADANLACLNGMLTFYTHYFANAKANQSQDTGSDTPGETLIDLDY